MGGYKQIQPKNVKAPEGTKIERKGPKYSWTPDKGEATRISKAYATAAIELGLGLKSAKQIERDNGWSKGTITGLRRQDTKTGKVFVSILETVRANLLSDVAEEAIGHLKRVLETGCDRDKVAAGREILNRLTAVEKREIERNRAINDYMFNAHKIRLDEARLELDRERLQLDHNNETKGLVIIPAQTADWRQVQQINVSPEALPQPEMAEMVAGLQETANPQENA